MVGAKELRMASAVVTVKLTPNELQVVNAALKAYTSIAETMRQKPGAWLEMKGHVVMDLQPCEDSLHKAISKSRSIQHELGLRGSR